MPYSFDPFSSFYYLNSNRFDVFLLQINIPILKPGLGIPLPPWLTGFKLGIPIGKKLLFLSRHCILVSGGKQGESRPYPHCQGVILLWHGSSDPHSSRALLKLCYLYIQEHHIVSSATSRHISSGATPFVPLCINSYFLPSCIIKFCTPCLCVHSYAGWHA